MTHCLQHLIIHLGFSVFVILNFSYDHFPLFSYRYIAYLLTTQAPDTFFVNFKTWIMCTLYRNMEKILIFQYSGWLKYFQYSPSFPLPLTYGDGLDIAQITLCKKNRIWKNNMVFLLFWMVKIFLAFALSPFRSRLQGLAQALYKYLCVIYMYVPILLEKPLYLNYSGFFKHFHHSLRFSSSLLAEIHSLCMKEKSFFQFYAFFFSILRLPQKYFINFYDIRKAESVYVGPECSSFKD